MNKRQPLYIQIRIKRMEAGLVLQAELAKKAGLSASLISRIESGKHQNIGIDVLRMISIALDYYEWDLNLSPPQF